MPGSNEYGSETLIYVHMQAASKSRSEVCSLLLSHGADPTLLNCHSKSALGTAIVSSLFSERQDISGHNYEYGTGMSRYDSYS